MLGLWSFIPCFMFCIRRMILFWQRVIINRKPRRWWIFSIQLRECGPLPLHLLLLISDMSNRIDTEQAYQLVKIAQNLQRQVDSITQQARDLCSHRDKRGELTVTPERNICFGCGSVVSFTVIGQLIDMRKDYDSNF